MKYQLFNDTDGILASPSTFDSAEEAARAVAQLRRRFEEQGYYLTAHGTKIGPAEVRLTIVPAKRKH